MCDAGSDVNFLPYNLVDLKKIKATTMKFYAANDTTIEILGRSRVTIELANHVKVESNFLISERIACPLFGSQWLKKNTTSWDFASGTLNIQGYKFKLKEEEDLPNYCQKIEINKDVVVPPWSRKTVAGLVLISFARVVNVPDWLTRPRMVKPWVQILHSLVDNRASNMSLMIVNDSEEDYLCKKGKIITTIIPDPMGIEGWYREDQAAQVHREAPLNFIGPIPSPNGKVKIPGSPKPKVKEQVTITIIPEPFIRRETTLPDVPSIPAEPDEFSKEVTFLETNELNSIVMQTLVSDHITKAVNSCAIKGIKVEGVTRKKHRAIYLDLTNSSSESEIESDDVSFILDTPSFNSKVKKKSRFSPAQSSSTDTLSPIFFSSGHDTDALHSSSLNSDNKENVDSCFWDSNVAVTCFSCSNLSYSNCYPFTNMPKNQSRGKKMASNAKTTVVLRSEATARKLADNRTFSCPTWSHNATRGICDTTCARSTTSGAKTSARRYRFLNQTLFSVHLPPKNTRNTATGNLFRHLKCPINTSRIILFMKTDRRTAMFTILPTSVVMTL